MSVYSYYPSPRNYEDDATINDSFYDDAKGTKWEKLFKLVRDSGFRTTRFVGKDFRDWFIEETQRENEEINNIRSAINNFFAYLEDKRFGSILVKTAALESLDSRKNLSQMYMLQKVILS